MFVFKESRDTKPHVKLCSPESVKITYNQLMDSGGFWRVTIKSLTSTRKYKLTTVLQFVSCSTQSDRCMSHHEVLDTSWCGAYIRYICSWWNWPIEPGKALKANLKPKLLLLFFLGGGVYSTQDKPFLTIMSCIFMLT